MQIKRLPLVAILTVASLVGCGGGSGGGNTGGTTANGGSPGNGGNGGSQGTAGTKAMGGGGAFTTSVGSGTKLSGLSSSQATQLCNDFNSYLHKTLASDYGCKLAGLFGAAFAKDSANSDADLQGACTTAYNSCLTTDGGVPTSDCTTANLMSNSAACAATVGNLTTCLDDQGAEYNQLPSCSQLTIAGLAAILGDAGSPAGPASCTIFSSGSACSDGVSMASSTAN
jgi:hypothetical protein